MEIYDLFDKFKLTGFAYCIDDGKHCYLIVVDNIESELEIRSSHKYNYYQLESSIIDFIEAN